MKLLIHPHITRGLIGKINFKCVTWYKHKDARIANIYSITTYSSGVCEGYLSATCNITECIGEIYETWFLPENAFISIIHNHSYSLHDFMEFKFSQKNFPIQKGSIFEITN